MPVWYGSVRPAGKAGRRSRTFDAGARPAGAAPFGYGEPVAFDDQPATDRERRCCEHFELPSPRAYLVARTNVIAVQLFNASIESDHLLFDLKLIDLQGADLTPSIASSVAPIAGTTVRQHVRISVTFTEPVAGVDAADLLIRGSPATGLSGSSPGPFSFTFDEPTPGAIRSSGDRITGSPIWLTHRTRSPEGRGATRSIRTRRRAASGSTSSRHRTVPR